MIEQRSDPRPVVWLSVGVLIVLVGAALNAAVGGWGGIVVLFGGLFVSTNLREVWRVRRQVRIALVLTLAVICIVLGVVAGVLVSPWEWGLVVYGVVIGLLGLIPLTRDLSAAAANAPR